MKKRIIKTTVLVALASLFLFGVCLTLACACPIPFGDALLGINGKVYEQKDAPADAASKIYIFVPSDETPEEIIENMKEQNVIDDIMIVPLENADIVVGPKEGMEKGGGREFSDWVKSSSDNTGYGEVSWIGPDHGTFLIRVTKPGYKEVVGEIEHQEAATHRMVIAILVPENNTD